MRPNKVKLFKSYTDVYFWNRDSRKRIKINQGGTSSSKTYSIMQHLSHECLRKKQTITVVAQTQGSLDRGALRDFKSLLNESELLRYCIKDASLMTGPYVFKNGSILEFVNLNDPKTARHGKRAILFLNEANYINYEAVRQLIMRSGQVFIDYNPDTEFWVHDEFIGRDDVDLFISNFTHNPYCLSATIQELMSFRDNFHNSGNQELRDIYEQTGDREDYLAWERTSSTYWKNKWYVYGLGKTGIVEGVIYQEVNWVPFLPIGMVKVGHALDWGYTQDPTAICRVGMSMGEIYGRELLYEKGLTTPQIMHKLPTLGISKRDLIIADSSNPDGIAQMQNKGWNVVPAYKPPGSLAAGVSALQGEKINLTKDSYNWKREQMDYKYKEKNGIFTNEPIDANNHLWDGMRYWRQYFYDPRKMRKRSRRPKKLYVIKN